MNKSEILKKLAEGFSIMDNILRNTDEAFFYIKKDNKWSIAENCKHLSLSVNPLNTVFSLPNFTLLCLGELNRKASTYDEIVEKYLIELAKGAVAPTPFVPDVTLLDKTKFELIDELKNINDTFLKKVDGFTEEDLDKYLIPHPVLGKLTIREMLYFTICHTLHHQKAIIFQQN